MQQAPNAFDGVAFHCYAGSVGQQDTFHAAYPQKEIYFTECTGTFGSDWWSDIKVFVFAIEFNKEAANILIAGLVVHGQLVSAIQQMIRRDH